MAIRKEIREIPNKKLLENDKGIIIVKKKIEFRRDSKKTPCDNCGNMHSSKTHYELENKRGVGLCKFCNEKVHNLTATNPRFRKDDLLTAKNQ